MFHRACCFPVKGDRVAGGATTWHDVCVDMGNYDDSSLVLPGLPFLDGRASPCAGDTVCALRAGGGFWGGFRVALLGGDGAGARAVVHGLLSRLRLPPGHFPPARPRLEDRA